MTVLSHLKDAEVLESVCLISKEHECDNLTNIPSQGFSHIWTPEQSQKTLRKEHMVMHMCDSNVTFSHEPVLLLHIALSCVCFSLAQLLDWLPLLLHQYIKGFVDACKSLGLAWCSSWIWLTLLSSDLQRSIVCCQPQLLFCSLCTHLCCCPSLIQAGIQT